MKTSTCCVAVCLMLCGAGHAATVAITQVNSTPVLENSAPAVMGPSYYGPEFWGAAGTFHVSYAGDTPTSIVYFDLTGTAIPGKDYILMMGGGPDIDNQSFTSNSGWFDPANGALGWDTHFRVIPIDNTTYSAPKTVVFTIRPNQTWVNVTGPRSVTLTIVDNESPVQNPATTVGVIEASPVYEGSPNFGTFIVQRTGNLGTTATVPYAISSADATIGVDYTVDEGATGTLTFLPNEVQKLLHVRMPANDYVYHPTRTVTLTLQPSTTCVLSTASKSLTLNDDDQSPTAPAVAVYRFSEGSGTTSADSSGVAPLAPLTLVNPVAGQWTTGYSGPGLSFAPAANSYLQATLSTKGVRSHSAFAFRAWIKPTAMTAGATRVILGNGRDAYAWTYALAVRGESDGLGSLCFSYTAYGAGLGAQQLVTTSHCIRPDVWQLVCVSGALGDAAVQPTTLYVDGIARPATWISGTGTAPPDFLISQFTIGALAQSQPGTRFSGVIDEVSCFGRLLNPIETQPPLTLGNADVGIVGAAGTTTVSSAGLWTVTGSGADIGGTADAFQYARRVVSGDVQITARVESVGNADPQAKAGVMLRDSLDPSSRFAFEYLTPQQGTAFSSRAAYASAATTVAGLTAARAPYWLRITRVGSVVTSSVSTDGVVWYPARQQTMTLSPKVYIGLAVTSHHAGAACTAVFSNVSIVSTPTGTN